MGKLKTFWITILLLSVIGSVIAGIGWLFATSVAIIIVSLMVQFSTKQKEPGEGDHGPVDEESKKIVMARQGFKCAKPGCEQKRYLVIHHITPRNMGGDNRLSNLVYLCPTHHAEAHDDGSGKPDYTDVPYYMKG